MSTQASFSHTFDIKKSDDQGLVFGWANIVLNDDGSEVIDAHGDSIPVEEIEKAAYNFVLNFGMGNEMHRPNTECAKVCESIVFTPDKFVALTEHLPEDERDDAAVALSKIIPTGWWAGFHITDAEIRQKVKDGTYRAFSIEGTATVEEIDD